MRKNLVQIKLNLEITWDSLRQHKTRNILTGFGVAWGIFILILLVGAGQGLQEGIMRLFGNYAQNSLWFYGGYTETGNGTRTPIEFNQDLIEDLKLVFPQITAITPQKTISGLMLNTETQSGIFTISAGNTDYFKIKLLQLSYGRSFNYIDKEQNRKVAIIGEQVADELFPNTTAVGRFIQVEGAWFKIIGQLKAGSIFEQGDQRKLFIPFNSMRETIESKDSFSEFGLTLHPKANINTYETAIKNYLARRYRFDPANKKALYVFNRKEQIKSFKALFGAIQAFLWAIGISLLLTGMVGISNTMFMVVKERTKEIGIHKSLGAKSKQILFMILTESISITFIAGAIGLLLGILTTLTINLLITPETNNNTRLVEGLSINFSITFLAITVLIIAGSIAGLFPSRKAANVTPIEAINYESL